MLVTGAGGPAGVAVLRWLVRGGAAVVAADSDPAAVGLRLVERSAVLPRAGDPRYVDVVVAAAVSGGADVVVPTVAEEVVALGEGRDRLAEAAIHAWLPEADAVRRCVDKWAFARAMAEAGVPVPATALAGLGRPLGSPDGVRHERVPGPWIVKPRHGRGSRQVVEARTKAALEQALATVDEPLVQTLLDGREFTADVLIDWDGRVAGVVPRWRLETRGGISTQGETFHSPPVEVAVAAAVAAVGLTGPANVQGFVTHRGAVAVTEINPRFSGGLPLSLAAGADLVGEYVRGARGLPVRRDRLVARPGVRMFRYFDEVFEYPDR